jgi:hypothetical protein
MELFGWRRFGRGCSRGPDGLDAGHLVVLQYLFA